MSSFFGLPSEADDRTELFNRIWENQILLSEVAKISVESSDTFSQYQFGQSFEAVRSINRARREAIEKELRERQGGYY